MRLPPQLPLFDRQVLVARANVLNLIERERPLGHQHGANSLFDWLEQQLNSGHFFALPETLRSPPGVPPLDAYVSWIAVKLIKIATVNGHPRNEYEAALLGRLRAISTISCEQCALRRHRCDGTLRDAATVRSNGSCVSGVRQAFEWIAERARLSYAQPAGSVDIRLAMENAEPRPHGLAELNISVSGRTTYFGDLSEVTVRLHPMGVKPACLRSVPYVVAHEVFVHALHGLRGAGLGARESAEPDDIFYEGWMDWAAREWLINELRTSQRPEWRLEISSARRYSEARADCDLHGEGRKDRIMVSAGHVAADIACGFLLDRPEPLTEFLQLSIHLNRLMGHKREVHALAWAAYAARDNAQIERDVRDAFVQFATDRDHLQLFESISRIKPGTVQ